MTTREELEQIRDAAMKPETRERNYVRLANALLAVLELHKATSDGAWCMCCFDGDDYAAAYPCATVQAIEREMGGGR